ncbi:MAG: hypothetical protein R2873_26025 [Caldilineaceae bacterium]
MRRRALRPEYLAGAAGRLQHARAERHAPGAGGGRAGGRGCCVRAPTLRVVEPANARRLPHFLQQWAIFESLRISATFRREAQRVRLAGLLGSQMTAFTVLLDELDARICTCPK